MATLVSFHAHPDDEAIATGGTIAKAAADGHRVVLVVATRGELGEIPPGGLAAGEALESRRVAETHAAADILGVHKVEFLGYRDSGMMGTDANDDPTCFWRADRDEAADRLARILRREDADVLTIYDDHGGYGHPDHIQVHRVGGRAGDLAGTPRLFEATMNRDHLRRMVQFARDTGLEIADLPSPESFDGLGSPESDITTAVDIEDYVDVKRSAMVAHASQIGETSLFLSLPDDAFRAVWGTEWFIARHASPHRTDLFGEFERAAQ